MIVSVILLMFAFGLLAVSGLFIYYRQLQHIAEVNSTFKELEGIILEFADLSEKNAVTLSSHSDEQSFWIKSLYYDFFNHLYRTHHLIKDEKGHLQAYKPNWSSEAELRLHRLGIEVKKEYEERGLTFNLGTPAGIDLRRDDDISDSSSSSDSLD